MKVLVVHNRYRSSSPGGEDRVVDQEHDALSAAGHLVRRFERSNDEIAGYSPPRRAAIPAGVVWNPGTARALAAELAGFHPDVVHVHNVFPLLSPSVLAGCARARVPCVVTLHNYQQACVRGDLFRDGTDCFACVGRALPAPAVWNRCYHGSAVATVPLALGSAVHRRAWRSVPAAYLFLSEAQRRALEPVGFPAWRSFVKPNLVPPLAPRARPDDLVVYLGRLAEIKGIRVLMRAWDRYLDDHRTPKLRLAVAGSGPLADDVEAWARTRPSVDVLGLLDRQACGELVRRATAVAVTSEWQEPFGLVVAEAMAAGVAPVATARGAFPELIEDGVDGLLYPPGDVGALARIFDRLERSPELVASLGAAALTTYGRRFRPERVVAQLEEVYRFAIAHPTGPGSASTSTVPAAVLRRGVAGRSR